MMFRLGKPALLHGKVNSPSLSFSLVTSSALKERGKREMEQGKLIPGSGKERDYLFQKKTHSKMFEAS